MKTTNKLTNVDFGFKLFNHQNSFGLNYKINGGLNLDGKRTIRTKSINFQCRTKERRFDQDDISLVLEYI